jgi:hypothetical protein
MSEQSTEEVQDFADMPLDDEATVKAVKDAVKFIINEINK